MVTPNHIYILKTTLIPVLFNPLKHHLAALRHTFSLYTPTDLFVHLLALGGSQMDMYTGRLSPEEIFKEIRVQLKAAGIDSRDGYEVWLAEKNHYATLVLSDTSRWILRLAADKALYIHLHPGRYSPHTLRVKAAALKTALAWWVARQHHTLTGDLLGDLNRVRKEIRLSPLRNAAESNHILEIMALLSEEV